MKFELWVGFWRMMAGKEGVVDCSRGGGEWEVSVRLGIREGKGKRTGKMEMMSAACLSFVFWSSLEEQGEGGEARVVRGKEENSR